MSSHGYTMFAFNLLKREGQNMLSWTRYRIPGGVIKEAYVTVENHFFHYVVKSYPNPCPQIIPHT